MINLFNYIDRPSPIHRLTGACKLVCLITWSLAAMTSFYTPLLVVLTVASFILFRVAKLKLRDISFTLSLMGVYVVMNNVEEISVGYASSDDVKVEIIDNSIANNIYSTSNNKTYNAVFGDLGVTNNSNTITLTHSLDNTRTQASGDPATRYDYKAQTFVVRVSHERYN